MYDDLNILPISAIAMVNGDDTPPTDSHETVLPSADTESVPSFFLYWAAALDMLVKEAWCGDR